jgi:hypothetical protein
VIEYGLALIATPTHDRDILASNNIKHIGMGYPEFMPVEQDYSFAMKQETPRSLVER